MIATYIDLYTYTSNIYGLNLETQKEEKIGMAPTAHLGKALAEVCALKIYGKHVHIYGPEAYALRIKEELIHTVRTEYDFTEKEIIVEIN